MEETVNRAAAYALILLAAACSRPGAGAATAGGPPGAAKTDSAKVETYPQLAEPNPVLPQGPPGVQRYLTPQPQFAPAGPEDRKLAVDMITRDAMTQAHCLGIKGGPMENSVLKVARFDLNGDGRHELWIQTTPCHYGETTPVVFVYTQTETGWRSVVPPSQWRDGLAVLDTKHNGWSDLGGWGAGFTLVRVFEYRHDGHAYLKPHCKEAPLTQMGAPNQLKVGAWRDCNP